jgi:hypothetical protein
VPDTSAPPPSRPDVLDEVRAGAAAVADRARVVAVVDQRLARVASDLLAHDLAVDPLGDLGPGAPGDPWDVAGTDQVAPAGVEAAVGLVLALDAVNFGSGWHPVVRKLPGRSGAVSMAMRLRTWAARTGGVSAPALARFTPALAHEVFEQPEGGPADDLMALFATSLADMGRLVVDGHQSSFTAFVASAQGSAAALVDALRALPSFDDVGVHDGEPVAILKRAQLAVADLHRGFGGTGPGGFDDVDRLTAFADNLVPHVLRLDGLLWFDPGLVARIDAGELLEPGSSEEVEIRAVGLHAVELLRAELARQGVDVPSWQLDMVLWQRGGRPEYKAHPRHRARSPFY